MKISTRFELPNLQQNHGEFTSSTIKFTKYLANEVHKHPSPIEMRQIITTRELIESSAIVQRSTFATSESPPASTTPTKRMMSANGAPLFPPGLAPFPTIGVRRLKFLWPHGRATDIVSAPADCGLGVVHLGRIGSTLRTSITTTPPLAFDNCSCRSDNPGATPLSTNRDLDIPTWLLSGIQCAVQFYWWDVIFGIWKTGLSIQSFLELVPAFKKVTSTWRCGSNN